MSATLSAALGRLARIEFATMIIAVLVYGGWIALTLCASRLPLALVMLLGGWIIAWQGSLQHETIHGHPTPLPALNRLIGFAPLNLWLPYDRYRQMHLEHHRTEHLTLPGYDTETRYVVKGDGVGARLAATLTATLAGRLLLGPALDIGRFLLGEIRAIASDQPGVRRVWIVHALLAASLMGWLTLVCRLSLADYVIAFVYPGAALGLLRSFAEHRADPDPARRVAIVEKAPVLGLLFMNNNLHAVHHAFPAASWRELPSLYAAQRQAVLEANGGLVYRGYSDVARRFLFKPHDVIVHPAQGALTPSVEALAR